MKKASSEKKSIKFEPRDVEELSRFFKVNKEEYNEIWIILTNKKSVDPQPVSGHEALIEAIRFGLIDSRTKNVNE